MSVTLPATITLLIAIGCHCVEDPSPSSAIFPINRLQFHHYFDSIGYKLFIEANRLDPNYLKLTIKGRTINVKGVVRKMKPLRLVSQDFDIPKDYKVNIADIHANYTAGLIVVTASNENEDVVRDIKIAGLNQKSPWEVDMFLKKASNSNFAQKRLKSINLIG